MIRTRSEPAANYRSVFLNGKTIRMPIDPRKPVTELRYPEFYDIAFGNKCVTGGNGRKDPKSACYYCYASAHAGGKHYDNIVDKTRRFFGNMDRDKRPYQVAIGGSQEPLEHPDFWDAVRMFKALDIVPNYTTNGVLVTDRAIALTKELCGGVAVTLHPHLELFWRRALVKLTHAGVRTNVHFIVSDTESVNRLKGLYDEYRDKAEYFVLLPYMNVGFAGGENAKEIDYASLEPWLDSVFGAGNIAFGANFYPFLKTARKWDVSLYEPEIMSKYLVMDDDMKVYNNSFDLREVPWRDGVVLESS
jgi:hypothetical protein